MKTPTLKGGKERGTGHTGGGRVKDPSGPTSPPRVDTGNRVWSVTHVTEEDFETTEGETEDLYDKLMEMTGWKVTDNENENEYDSILV